MRRRSGIIAWGVVLLAIVSLLLAWQYFSYLSARRYLPAGMTMAGMSAEGMTPEQALNALEVAFATPIEVFYEGQLMALAPETVELRYDPEQTRANLDQALDALMGFDGFVAYVLRRPLEPIDVPVAVTYSQERLDGFLTRVANQYDRPPQDPVPIPASLTFSPGQPGYQLDMDASRARLGQVLVSAVEHQAELVVRTEGAPPMQIELLRQLIQTSIAGRAGLVAGVFVKDLDTGDEISLSGDVAFTGADILRIAVMEEVYRARQLPLDVQVSDWLSDTMGVENNTLAANMLLTEVVGGGDAYAGAENLTASMGYLGLVNTFMVSPYAAEGTPPTVSTPANSRADLPTQPAANMQTTPLDTGLLLEMVYQCSRDGGTLMAAYPDAFTPEECQQMIDWMARIQADSHLRAGIPAEMPIAHKQSFTSDTHADAALVFSPGGDFALVVFLYRPEWLDWEESSALMTEIGTATYNYFNPGT